MGAFPDGIIVCDCCGKGLLEIKCPHKYRNGLEDWQDDKNFPFDESGQIKKDHMYYAQVQGQLLVLHMNFCDFFYLGTIIEYKCCKYIISSCST